MNRDISKSFESHFGNLKDLRIERTKLYLLSEILFVVLSGSVCGAESRRDFVLFGEERLKFLQEYYSFENGIPSKNTFSRVFAALDTEAFKLFKYMSGFLSVPLLTGYYLLLLING